MKRYKYFLFILGGLLLLGCLWAGGQLIKGKQGVESILPAEEADTGDLTLLKRAYEDLDGDGKEEAIELFTSAKRDQNGMMGWDDGQRWLLLVTSDGRKYIMFDDYVQLGQLDFWVVVFNKSQTDRPGDRDLEKHVYAMRTTHSVQIFDYYWDQKNTCFKREVVFNPPRQWDIKAFVFSNYDASLIEPER